MTKLNTAAKEWLKENNACCEGFSWANKECKTLAEVVATARPDWAIWVYTRPGVLDDRTLWLFACWCAYQSLPNWYAVYPDDHRPRQAIEARRGWLEGNVTNEELESAAWSAWSARSAAESARSAARSAAWSAAESAWSAAESARSAAESAAESARSAAWSAAESARSAAWSAAWSAQANWLRENAKPVFVDA